MINPGKLPFTYKEFTMSIITRYAPSPTGIQHVGGARTALYNWMFAKQNGGKFYLRIEDTDRTRYVNTAAKEIIDSFQYMGLDWDDGPSKEELIGLDVDESTASKYGKGHNHKFVQSNRLEMYRQAVEQLIENGFAYRVFTSHNVNDSNNRLTVDDSKSMKLNMWRNAPAFHIKKAMKAGIPYHVRLKLPRNEDTVVFDRLRGNIKFNWNRAFDTVLLKTDGFPTYHLASVVDDHDMGVTHVIRGEEWLPSLPIHTHLYQCFDWEPPQFIHAATILKPNGKGKMSKREVSADGSTRVPTAVTEYRDNGFLSTALNNFMALTGWSPKSNKEIFRSLDDLLDSFNIDNLSVSPAAWNYNKLLHINKIHMGMIPGDVFANLVMKEVM